MPARVALFENGFAVDGAIRQFTAFEVGLLADYVPAALVLPLQLALTLADQKQRGLLDLPTLTTAIVVLTSLGTRMLDHHRDLLWRAFAVPVFEQLRNEEGIVIARECEVHDGLHIDQEAVLPDLSSLGEVVREHCECGAETPRLRYVSAPLCLAAAS